MCFYTKLPTRSDKKFDGRSSIKYQIAPSYFKAQAILYRQMKRVDAMDDDSLGIHSSISAALPSENTNLATETNDQKQLAHIRGRPGKPLSSSIKRKHSVECIDVDSPNEQKAMRADPFTSILRNPEVTTTQSVNDECTSPIWRDEFELLCWNVDGLDDRFLKLRTDYLVDTIKTLKPGAVYLQEVVNLSLDLLKRKLRDKYHFIAPTDDLGRMLPYFCIILLSYDQLLPFEGSEETYWYPGTVMGRHLISVCARPLNRPDECIEFLTTHLESTWQFARERKSQFQQIVNRMASGGKDRLNPPATSILGGDMNIVDSELSDVEIPSGVKDIWKFLNSPESCMYTWDLSKNTNIESQSKRKPRKRFDRLYWLSKKLRDVENIKQHMSWMPKEMKMVGTSKLESCEMFPSDHFGLLVKFKRI